jgi:pimeloyl-ACP methyl ester carboxylesterase
VTLTLRSNWLDPHQPTVLFVNAVGMRAALLDGLAARFAGEGFNFLSWELRGSPGPSLGHADCTLAAHVADAIAVLAASGVSRVHLVGWCTGASVAACTVADLGDRVATLVAVDGAFLFGGLPGGPLGNAMYEMCGEIVADVNCAAKYHELTHPRGNEGAVLGLNDRDLVAEVTLPYSGGVEDLIRYAYGIRASCDYDPVQVCSEIDCPTLFLAHLDDKMVSSKNSVRAAELIPGSQLVVIGSGGHYGLFTDPGCVSTMAAFMRSGVRM